LLVFLVLVKECGGLCDCDDVQSFDIESRVFVDANGMRVGMRQVRECELAVCCCEGDARGLVVMRQQCL
jgi:hypothetical protein